ncbi:ribosome-associated translation inhibitor RaiA [Alteromonadaceae bacterium BrNp21-10]|nr:ribosome-associated translation inhibitor RaiA [Alteromonadaceae bacterium BrNp21-10]
MKINLSGHHVDISTGVKEHVEQKLSKLASHFPSLIAIDAIITKEHGEFDVELVTTYEGSRLASKGKGQVMYPAIAQAAKKLDAALVHRKGQLKEGLHKKPVATAPEIASEIIQGMDLH